MWLNVLEKRGEPSGYLGYGHFPLTCEEVLCLHIRLDHTKVFIQALFVVFNC